MANSRDTIVETEGPWPLGMYNNIQVASLPGETLSYLENLVVDSVGNLVARPGFWRAYDGDAIYVASATHTILHGLVPGIPSAYEKCVVLHAYKAGVSRFAFAVPGGTLIYPKDLATSNAYSSTFTYNGYTYFVQLSGTAGKGQRSNNLSGGVYSDVANMPMGNKSFILKERAFIFSGLAATPARVYYSKATDPTIWAAPDGGFFDVSPGDGGTVVDFFVLKDIIYIIKTTGVWAFTFVTDPAVDGILQLLSPGYSIFDTALVNDTIYIIDSTGLHVLENGRIGQNLLEDKIFLTYEKAAIHAFDKYILGFTDIIRSLGPSGVSYQINFIYDTVTGIVSFFTYNTPFSGRLLAQVGISSDNRRFIAVAGESAPGGAAPYFNMILSKISPATHDSSAVTANATSPRYAVITRRLIFNDPMFFRRFKWLVISLFGSKHVNDAVIQVSMSKYNNNTATVETFNATPIGIDKLQHTDQRVNSLSIQVLKNESGLSTTLDVNGLIAGVSYDFRLNKFYIAYSVEQGQVAQ